MRRALPLVAALTVANVASARTETAPQQFKAGAVVKLRALDIDLKLPPSDEGWTLSLAVEGTDAWDIVRKGDDLSIELSRAKGNDCDAVAHTLDAQKAKRRAASPLAPTTFEPWSYDVAGGAQRLCTNTYTGPVTADVSGAAANPADVVALLSEVARMVGGRRGTAGLVAKGPTVAIVGKTMLAASGIQADIPKGWDVRVQTLPDGTKIDVLERDTTLKVTVERRVASCATSLPQGKTVLDAPYLPEGFGPASVEGLHTATFCMELGSDAIVASVTYAGGLAAAGSELNVVRSILAPAAAARSGVGGSIKSDHDVDEREDEMEIGARIRGVASLDLLWFNARGESNRPFGAALSFDAYSSTARHGLGFAVELGARGGVGTNKFLTWDVFGGIGGALTFGRFMGMLTVGGGADAFHGVRYKTNETFFEARTAAYVHVAPRLIIPVSRRLAFDVRGAYVHRFDDVVDREFRGHLGVMWGAAWFGVRVTQYKDRALLASLVLGFSF